MKTLNPIVPTIALATVLLSTSTRAGVPADGVLLPAPLRLVVLDLTGDGLPEKLHFDARGSMIELNLGGGRFEPVQQELPAVRVHQVLVTDLDGDGRLDAYLVGPDSNHVWLGQGEGRFRDAGTELGLEDAGFGLSAERLDVDGDGLADLLLRNATGDVLFRARPAGGRIAWDRDPATPEVVAADPLRDGMATLVTALLGGAVDPRVLPGDMEVQLRLDDLGRPLLRLLGRDPAPAKAPAAAATAASTLAPAGPAPSPTPFTSPDAKYVNDNAGEVDAADVVDGSLTGADLSTVSGSVGIGTLAPKALLHVAAQASFPALSAIGRAIISGDSLDGSGDAELRLANSATAGSGMSLYYDGGLLGHDKLHVYATANGGKDFSGPYLTIDRSSGQVGIGTASPSADLHVVGNDNTGTVMIAPAANLGANNFSQLRLVEDADGMFGMSLLYDGTDNQLKVWGTTDGNQTGTGPHLVIHRDTGRVGILTTNPNASLGVKVIPGSTSILRGLNESDQTVFRVMSDGRTGVGTDAPNAALCVKQVPSSSTLFSAMNAAGTTVASITNAGRVVCKEVEITGGADLVESFVAGDACEPGTVVVIDEHHPGQLVASTTAWDRRVAGVVSGAGGVHPGLRLAQSGVLEGDTPVALSGRVWVKCSAENGAIAPGDMLVSASLAGHAMRADDPARGFGAVIGKAMSALDEGTGLVLVLVNLQ